MNETTSTHSIMRSSETILILNRNTVYHHDFGMIRNIMLNYPKDNIFIEDYEYLSSLDGIQLANELSSIIDNDISEIIKPEFLELDLDKQLTEDLAIATTITKSVIENQNKIPFYVLTPSEVTYERIGNERLYYAPIIEEHILTITDRHEITAYMLCDIDMLISIMKNTKQKVFMLPYSRRLFANDNMTIIKRDYEVRKYELENQHELLMYSYYGGLEEFTTLG